MRLNSKPNSQQSALDPDLLNQRTFDARHDFHDLFELLLQTRELTEQSENEGNHVYGNRLASELQVLAQSNIEKLYALPRDSQYSRHIIGTRNEWVGYICRWEQQTSSAIHGHPYFVYYQVLEGEVNMDLYKPVKENIVAHDQSIRLTRGDTIWNKGPKACYDNLIHKVSTLDSPGFTLHLFSENPARGHHFKVA